MLEPYLRPFEPGRGLQEQLRECLLNAVLDGALPPTEPLPSSRKLSQLLKVSRNTVVLVYEQLMRDGFLSAVDRRGYFVNEGFVRKQLRVRLLPVPEKWFTPGQDAPDWGKRLGQRTVVEPAIVKPRNWRDYTYPFIYGQVEYDEATAARWRHCTRLAQTRAHLQSWMDDHVMHDDPLLVEQIVQRVLPRRAIRARPEQVLVTVGTQNSLFLLAQALAHPELVFGMENPGYVDARNIFARAGCQMRPLRVDSQGLVPGAHLHTCDLVFCTPSYQSPTGVTMPVYRRMDLLERARQHDFVLIEDDYDTEFNDLGSNHPALKSFDDSGRVIYLGSLSKNLLPGLRLGFIVADEALIEALRALRRYVYRHPPTNNQRTMALFLWMGYGEEHARRWRERLAPKWQAISRALAAQLPQCRSMSLPGSSLLWVQGPQELDARTLQIHAARRGVLIEPGDVHFFESAQRPTQFFRLGFGAMPLHQIEPGMTALGMAWRDCLDAGIKKES
ncbi:MAG: PLP-dependent aminotransferase family protein [Acidovorax sp.]